MESAPNDVPCFEILSAKHNVVCKAMLLILADLLKNSSNCTAYSKRKEYSGYPVHALPDVSVECEDAEGIFIRPVLESACGEISSEFFARRGDGDDAYSPVYLLGDVNKA